MRITSPAGLVIGIIALSSACASLKHADQYLSERQQARSVSKKEAPVLREAQKQPDPRPQISAAEDAVASDLQALPSAGESYDPRRVVALINGQFLSAEGAPGAEIHLNADAPVEIAVFNGTQASLESAELVFMSDLSRLGNAGNWQREADGLHYWCRAPIHPADARLRPLSYFRAASAFELRLPPGGYPAQLRIKSLDHPEWARTFRIVVQ